ncbi:MAG: PIG-L deacetylase family protein [Verrucomicrobiota bacterium]
MSFLIRIAHRLSDPVFYRKQRARLARLPRKFADQPEHETIAPLSEFDRALVVIAHPDDEVFCSGLILELIDSGVRVDIHCLTRGEGGPLGPHTRAELGPARETEMRAACEVLGITELSFADLIDPVGTEYRVFPPEIPVKDLAERLQARLAEHDLILSHGSSGEYWHPAHLLVYDAVKLATETLGEDSPQWLTFQARNPEHPIPKIVNWNDPAWLRINVSRHHEQRWKALQCHDSQLELFASFAGNASENFVEALATEHYAKPVS